MKYFIFYKENNDFTDILTDKNIKKLSKFKIKFSQYLILGSENIPDDLKSYIMLKYGDDLKNSSSIFIDRKPKINIDYTPDREIPKKFKKL